MSQHKQAMSPELRQALINHGLETDTPSQLADCFRNGWKARAVKDAVGGDEPVAWMSAINPNLIYASKDCLNDDAIPLYRRPQASAAVPEDVWKPLLEAVMREMPKQEYRGNAPGHAHAVPGIWDSDNVPYLAGKPCAWCLAYITARKLLAASQPEVKP